jgi:uncharacterized zinc-type alcohol dehydrogenase-like protein
MTTTKVQAYAAQSATSALAPFGITRREPGPLDVEIEILYCGVCHSDLHQARNEWHNTIYPCVPGHEIVGRVTRVGSRVTKFKPGDLSAVGCMVDSCRTCENCRAGLEQHCLSFPTLTYNSDDKYLGGHTFGGYSTNIVVDEAFVLRVPAGLDLASTAPLLCAGITTYSEDANSFFRAFHLWEGTSPGEWRTLHRTAEVAVLGRQTLAQTSRISIE